MTVQHENYLTAMLESLKAAPSSMDCEGIHERMSIMA